jgi:hypothetical protein
LALVATLAQRFDRASRQAHLFWVVVAAFAAHATALKAGYVWLDHAHIEAGLGIEVAFTRSFAGTGFYRPLTALSLWLGEAIGGGPGIHHSINLLLHAGASAMVLIAAEALHLGRRAATVAALLFAVHPITSLSASAIAFRSEPMITIALLGLVVAHLRKKPILAAICIVGGGLCKETALALAPLLIVALEVAPSTRSLPRKLLASEGVALLGVVGLHTAFAPAWPARFPELGISAAIGTRLATLAKSAGAFAVPIQPRICDAFPITEAWALPSLLGACGLVWFYLGARKGEPIVLAFLLALLPSLQLVPTHRWWSPHYLYVPLAFACMFAAKRLTARGPRWLFGALGACVALGVISWRDGKRYRNDTELWAPEVLANPACREGSFYIAEDARKRGALLAAAGSYEAALAPHRRMLAYVDVDAALQNLGIVRSQLGELDAAQRAFESALETSTSELTRRKLRFNLAALALRQNDPARAVKLLETEAHRDDALAGSRALYEKARLLAR